MAKPKKKVMSDRERLIKEALKRSSIADIGSFVKANLSLSDYGVGSQETVTLELRLPQRRSRVDRVTNTYLFGYQNRYTLKLILERNNG